MSRVLELPKQWLAETGLPWRIEEGTKHYKLFLRETFVDIWPRRPKDDVRRNLNVRARIRRTAVTLR